MAAKWKFYKTAARAAMFYRLETVARTKKRHGAELEVKFKELKILGFALGVNRLGRIRKCFSLATPP